MKQTSSLTRSLTAAQDPPARKTESTMVYRIYLGLPRFYPRGIAIELVARYFDGATLFDATGLWKSETEPSLVVEIVTDNRQSVYSLAGDLRIVFGQSAVLITWSPVSSFLLTEDSIRG